MRISKIILLATVLFSCNSIANSEIKADWKTLTNLQQHLPLNIDELKYATYQVATDVECLAWTIYFESRGGSHKEKIATAYVPINRTKDSRFSTDICTNIFQFHYVERKKVFQFPWAGRKLTNGFVRDEKSWVTAQQIAMDVYTRKVNDPTNGAIFLHNKGEFNNLSKVKSKILIGNHYFFK